MKIRNTVLVAAVAAGLMGAGACSVTPSTATPAAASPAATATVTAVSTALVTVTASSPSTAEASPADSDVPSSGSSSPSISPTAEPTDAIDATATIERGDTSQNPESTGDPATTAWVGGICGGMGRVMGELVDGRPHLSDDASVSTLRRAMVDYYALSAKTAAAAYDDSQSLEPPNVTDGPAIHQAYQDFVGGLRDIFTDASISMARTADVSAIEAINDKVDQRITTMGTDNTALQAMSGGELAALAKTIPACKDLSDTVAGS